MQLNLGDFTIDGIVEMDGGSSDALKIFSNLTPETFEEHRSWMSPRFAEPESSILVMPKVAFLVRGIGRTILIDTCIGNNRTYPGFPSWTNKTDTVFMDRLAELGVSAQDVDTVVHTHLHGDHVGWDTSLVDGQWVPSFDNADYVISRAEYAFWAPRWHAENRPYFGDTIVPVVEAGRAKLVANDAEIAPGIQLYPIVGHTPAHVTIRIRSGGREALIAGDWIHSPLQCEMPELLDIYDRDPEKGRIERNAVLEKYADTDTIIAPTHFPLPCFGHFVRKGGRFAFRYLEE